MPASVSCMLLEMEATLCCVVLFLAASLRLAFNRGGVGCESEV